MEPILILISCYIAVYAAYIFRLTVGYGNVAHFDGPAAPPSTSFTIVVPFRNEARNLPALLDSFARLDYPQDMIEYIFVDDFSNDDSYAIINKWRLENNSFHTTLIENVRISPSPKKDAIGRAIPIALHDWIVTTDADCTVPATWLSLLNSFASANKVEMICGPVLYKTRRRLNHWFQQADLLALQGVTIGAFGLRKAFMCNAANFAFTRSFFRKIGGFAGVDNVAGGDDVFLLQKAVALNPASVGYLKSREAVVLTAPADGWIALLSQRVRWASKAKSYISKYGETLAAVTFFGNAALACCMLTACLGYVPLEITGLLFCVKFVPDYVIALRANRSLRGKLFFPLLSGIIYPFFATAIGIYSLYGRYRWKGRSLK